MSFRPATVAGTKALTCIYSESGGGKTYSALLLARGLVGPTGRIALIDTENRRGELYADDPKIGGYDVMQLGEPFSPQRYMDAIDEAEQSGYDAIVIDSMSHEWEGIGGVLDMAQEIALKRNRDSPAFGDWKEPKTQHKHLIAKMMRSPAHVIVCARAQYKSRQIEKRDYAKFGIRSQANTTVIRDEYQSPIQEERFIFEMTVHMQMSNQHPGVPIITKCPEMLMAAFPNGEQITVETGARMARFYNQGAPPSVGAADIADQAEVAARGGMADYKAFFEGLQPHERRDLANSAIHERMKAIAADIDKRAAEMAAPEPDDPEPPREEPTTRYVAPNFDTMPGGATDDDDIPFEP